MRPASRSITFLILSASSVSASAQPGGPADPPPYRAITDDIASMRALAKARLSATAQARVAALELTNPDLWVYLPETGSTKVRILAGQDLASPVCYSSVPGEPTFSEAWLLGFVRCFLRENHPLYVDSGSAFSFSELALVGQQAISADEYQATFRQLHNGLPVRPGLLKLLFLNNKLAVVSGDIHNTDLFPPRPTTRLTVQQIGNLNPTLHNPREIERFVRAPGGNFAIRLLAERLGQETQVVIVDETTGTIFERQSAAHNVPTDFQTTLRVYDYPYSSGMWPPSNLSAYVTRTQHASFDDLGGGQCRFQLHHLGNGSGLSQHDFPYMVKGRALALGTNGATSPSTTRTLTSAGANFIASGVSAGPDGLTDHLMINDFFTTGDNGLYLIPSVAQTVLTGDRNWPTGSLTALDYYVYDRDVTDYYFRDSLCSNANPFDINDHSPGGLQFELANAFNILVKTAEMVQNSGSFFIYTRYSKGDLRVRVTEYEPGGGADYRSDLTRIGMYFNIIGGPQLGGSASQPRAGAHEYGHYVHHTHAPGTDPPNGRRSVSEGWAETFPARYARNQVRISEWAGLDYDYPFVAYDPKHSQTLVNGELLSDEGELSYYPSSQCSADENGCPGNPGDESCPYTCGQPIVWAYWELNNNICGQSYKTCGWHNLILQQQSPNYEPWEYANWAYAYAISMISEFGLVGEFMTHVLVKYSQIKSSGYISQYDLDRVNSVLTHHCTIGNQCTDPNLHHLPGSPLPSQYTWKTVLWSEAENAFPPNGSTVVNSNSSNGKYVNFAAGTELRFSRNIVVAHNYKLKMLAKRQVNTNHILEIWVNGVFKASWFPITSQYTWQWYDSLSPSIFLQAGSNSVVIKNRGSIGLDADAFYIEWAN